MDVITCKPNDCVFTDLLKTLYADEVNPHFPNPPQAHLAECFICLENDTPLARAALFVNPNITVKGKKMAQVGSFEALNNQKVVKQLFKAIEYRAKQMGFAGIVGPMNGSTWQAYRFNQKFKNYFFTEYQHPKYYEALWKKAGFNTLAMYNSALSVNIQNQIIPNINVPAGITVRNINLQYFEAELVKIHRFCNEAFADNFLFSPIALSDFMALYLPLKPSLQEDFILMAEEENQIVGLLLALRNRNDITSKSLIIKTLARLPKSKYKGIGHVLSAKLYACAQTKGYQSIIHAFMLESGSSKKVSGSFSGTSFKRYSLLSKTLENDDQQ